MLKIILRCIIAYFITAFIMAISIMLSYWKYHNSEKNEKNKKNVAKKTKI